MPTKLFDNKEITDGETEFISNVLCDDKTLEVASVYQKQAQTLAILRLAKEIECSTKTNNKSSLALNLLTGALVFVGIVNLIIMYKIGH